LNNIIVKQQNLLYLAVKNDLTYFIRSIIFSLCFSLFGYGQNEEDSVKYDPYELYKNHDYKGVFLSSGFSVFMNSNMNALISSQSATKTSLPINNRIEYVLAYGYKGGHFGLEFCSIPNLTIENNNIDLYKVAFYQSLYKHNFMQKRGGIFDLYFSTGYSFGTLIISNNVNDRYNPYFSPSVRISPQLILFKKLIVQVSGNYELDITKSKWKGTNSLGFDPANVKTTQFTIEGGIGYLLSNRSGFKRKYYEDSH
jgi:hypothetical protein